MSNNLYLLLDTVFEFMHYKNEDYQNSLSFLSFSVASYEGIRVYYRLFDSPLFFRKIVEIESFALRATHLVLVSKLPRGWGL